MTGNGRVRIGRKITGRLRHLVFGRVPKLFDAAYYVNTYPDAAASGLDPFLHYILIGGRLGYDPNGDFDTAFYKTQTRSRRNPLRHYIKVGAKEGLDPHPQFSTFGYLGRYPDVAANRTNPLQHYREHGRPERRIADPSTRLPRAMVALVGIPSSDHWRLPSEWQNRVSLTMLRRLPHASGSIFVERLRVSIGLDFDVVDGLVDVLGRFSSGVQDSVSLEVNANPERGGGVPSLMLALDHCYVTAVDHTRQRIVSYAQATLWDLRPSNPRIMLIIPHGTIGLN